jgi:hypothetical protein
MAYPPDPAVKSACDLVREKEQALTRQYERTREELAALRQRIAAGIIPPRDLNKHLRLIR